MHLSPLRGLRHRALAWKLVGALAALAQGLVAAETRAADTRTTPSTTTAAERLVRYLEAEGVTTVFGVPGEETLYLIDALRRSPTIRFVLAGNEQGASLMATGYARATGRLGVVLSTLGPGATNLVTGAANALSENVPLLLITGQGPIERPEGYHQKLSLTRLFRPVTRLSLEARRPGSVVATARKLVAAALANPGPVHLSLPAAVAGASVSTRGSLARAPAPRRALPDEASLETAAALLRDAKCPVILAGDGVLQELAGPTARRVRAFARLHGLPLVPSAIAKGMFPSSDALVVPPLDAFARGKAAELLKQSDLIFTVGYHPTEIFDPKTFNPGGRARIVHLSPQAFPAEHRVTGFDLAVALKTGIIEGLNALHGKLGEYRAPEAAREAAHALRVRHAAELAPYLAGEGDAPIKPQRIMAELRRALDAAEAGGARAMVFGDVGLNKGFLTQWLEVRKPGEVMVPNGLSTMGVALPAAIGAQVARPELKVFAVSGDGGLMMNVQELATAAQQRLPVVHVVLLDRRLGLIENHQLRSGLVPAAVEVPALNLRALAQGLGAKGYVVRSAKELGPLIRQALLREGPTLIGVPVDYGEAQAAAAQLGQSAGSQSRGPAEPTVRALAPRPAKASRRAR
ncbi:MAG: thiamine pyrophosphate-binding protein [Deltaproteobacteria bacterium]|nr:thiamine pyrophosphate-binding protein [Deltaproteobacteria bacterium]